MRPASWLLACSLPVLVLVGPVGAALGGVGSAAAALKAFPPQLVGESDTTHFWMPGVNGVVVLPSGDAIVSVDENGDGTAPTNCSAVRCPPRDYLMTAAAGRWHPVVGSASHASNALIRLPGGEYRGCFLIAIDSSSNTSGTVLCEDWKMAPTGGGATTLLRKHSTPLTGLPRVHGPRLQIMPSGVALRDGTDLMMAYGAMSDARTLSSFLLASNDSGNSPTILKFQKKDART